MDTEDFYIQRHQRRVVYIDEGVALNETDTSIVQDGRDVAGGSAGTSLQGQGRGRKNLRKLRERGN